MLKNNIKHFISLPTTTIKKPLFDIYINLCFNRFFSTKNNIWIILLWLIFLFCMTFLFVLLFGFINIIIPLLFIYI